MYPIKTDGMINEKNIEWIKNNPKSEIEITINWIKQLNRCVELHDDVVDKYSTLELKYYVLIIICILLIGYIVMYRCWL